MPDVQVLRVDGTNGYIEQAASATGQASVALSNEQAYYPFSVALATGNIDSIPPSNIFSLTGENTSISAQGTEVVSAVGGAFDPPPAAAPVDVISTSVNDTSGGTGTQLIFIRGVGSDWLELAEVVAMNGTSTASTLSNFFRVNSIFSFITGASDVNEGDITTSIGGKNVAKLLAGKGFISAGSVSIPKDRSGFVSSLDIGVSKGNTAQPTVGVRYSSDEGVTFNIVRFGPLTDVHESPHLTIWPNVFQATFAGEWADIWIEAKNTGTGNMSVVAAMTGFML